MFTKVAENFNPIVIIFPGTKRQVRHDDTASAYQQAENNIQQAPLIIIISGFPRLASVLP